jgi:hemolysin III
MPLIRCPHTIGRRERYVKTQLKEFPSYTAWERLADASIHVTGVIAALVASSWLLANAPGEMVLPSLAVYCAGLVGMLSLSALYNIVPHIPAKRIARRLDRGMIYIMIAGTYTPLTVNRLPGWIGLLSGIFIWVAAVGGAGLALVYPNRYDRLKFALYLILGWSIIALIRPLSLTVSVRTVVLLLAGAVVYSVGAVVQRLWRFHFHNALWHLLVLLAASLHFFAITEELLP